MVEETPVDRLRRDGIAPFGAIDITPALVHLADKTVWNAHVKAKATQDAKLRQVILDRQWPAFSHSMADVVKAPGILAAAVAMLPVAAAYFGQEPLLYSLNAFWTQPALGYLYTDTHDWHRDEDDRKQLAMFIYGTDVTVWDDGAHLYQPATQKGGAAEATGAIAQAVTGPMGTVWLEDPSGLHMGVRPTRTARLLFWARWGVSDPPDAYRWDRLSPVAFETATDVYPADPVVRRAIRLVIG